MALPKYDDIYPVLLDYMCEHSNATLTVKSIEPILAERMQVSAEDRQLLYESGNAYVFKDRVQWALSYLKNAGFLERPKRGVYQLAPTAQQWQGRSIELKAHVQEQIKARQVAKSVNANAPTIAATDLPTNGARTPQDTLESAFQAIRDNAYAEILDTIMQKSPYAFEALVLRLS